MINFINKAIEKVSIERKKNNWKEGVILLTEHKDDFTASEYVLEIIVDNICYELYNYNNSQGTEIRYSSPYNDAYPRWTKKHSKQRFTSKPEIVNIFWWRYKAGMKLKGEIKDNIFYPNE